MPQQLTSVKINSELFERFKIDAIKNKFSIQKLTERAMYLYDTDPQFRKTLHAVVLPKFD